MRTTLEIDPRVLSAARARVNARQNKSIGQAVSELALAGLASQEAEDVDDSGIVLLPTTPDQVITDEMIAQALLDE